MIFGFALCYDYNYYTITRFERSGNVHQQWDGNDISLCCSIMAR